MLETHTRIRPAAGGAHITAAQGRGLEYTFIIMLAPLAASEFLLLKTRRRYLRDVATADSSERVGATAPSQVVDPH